MRVACLVVLVAMVALLAPQAGAWRARRAIRRIRVRRIARTVAPAVARFALGRLIGRDVTSVDLNEDGFIDQSEAEEITNEVRAARDLLSLLDENEDLVVSHDEFVRGLRDIEMAMNDEDDDDDELTA